MLRGVLLWTVNDFPTQGNFFGHCKKGYKACPIYSKNAHAIQLTQCRKEAYTGHRRSLNNHHQFHMYKKSFNGEQEFGDPPKPLSGEEIYEKDYQLKN